LEQLTAIPALAGGAREHVKEAKKTLYKFFTLSPEGYRDGVRSSWFKIPGIVK
jgi:hypothetical protein